MADRECEADLSRKPFVGLCATPFLQIIPTILTLAVLTAAAPVEGEGHGVKNGGFAAPRRSFNQKHSFFRELLKIDNLSGGIGAEGLNLQP